MELHLRHTPCFKLLVHKNRQDLAELEVVQLAKQLTRKHHSSALAQLASRMAAAILFGTSGGVHPFAKVKGLIGNMIAKLESEDKADATEKVSCDEETAKTKAKRGERRAAEERLEN